MADDVCRFLRNEAVLAGPPSAIYHIRKFLQRHQTAALTTLAFISLLIAGATIASLGWLRASDASAKLSVALDAATESRNKAKTAQGLAERLQAAAEDRARRLAISQSLVRKDLYASEMAAAKRAFDQRRTNQVIELLGRYR